MKNPSPLPSPFSFHPSFLALLASWRLIRIWDEQEPPAAKRAASGVRGGVGRGLDAARGLRQRADAARAVLDPLRSPFNQNRGCLDVRAEQSLRLQMGVADVVPGLLRLATPLAHRHDGPLPFTCSGQFVIMRRKRSASFRSRCHGGCLFPRTSIPPQSAQRLTIVARFTAARKVSPTHWTTA